MDFQVCRQGRASSSSDVGMPSTLSEREYKAGPGILQWYGSHKEDVVRRAGHMEDGRDGRLLGCRSYTTCSPLAPLQTKEAVQALVSRLCD